MLGENEILELAKARRIRPYQEELRYLQALILYSLSDSPLVAKGGTYLWMFHGLNRFSQDLDYTSIG
ncbi:MAG: nucleotidyl transferase AbiEii/AbiGii toxin family protein, partial [Candidatus Hadarchaeales archaeon]